MTENKVEHFFNTPSKYFVKRYGLLIRRDLLEIAIQEQDFLNKDIADIGCGDGSLSLPFLEQSKSLMLIDISQPMLDLARDNIGRFKEGAFSDKVNYWKGDIRDYKQDRSYDLVLVIGVLSHVNNVEGFMKSLINNLKSDGKLVIQFSTWYHPLILLTNLFSKRGYHMNKLSTSKIGQLADLSGFQLKFKRQYSFPFPGMRFLNDKLLYKFQSYFVKKKALAWMGADYFMVLQKK
jgi:SAM-dependent methyltransferase